MNDVINLEKCYEADLDTNILPLGRAVTVQDEGGEGIAIGTLQGNKMLPRQKDIEGLASELASIVTDAKSFGAKGDGITDDCIAIQNAIDYCHNKGGGTVLLSTGIFLCGSVKGSYNALLYARDNVSIKGTGFNSILKAKAGLNFAGDTGYFNFLSTELITDSVSNCIFEDFTFDLNGNNNLITNPSDYAKADNAIKLWNGGNIIIQNVKSCNNAGLQHFRFGRDDLADFGTVKILNCFVSESGGSIANNHQIDHSSIYYIGNDLLIDGCSFNNQNIPSEGGNCAIENHARHSIISNNKISGYTNANIIAPTTADMEQALYIGNSIDNCGQGFFLWSIEGFDLNDLKIVNNNVNISSSDGYGLHCLKVISDISKIEISGNTFRYTGTETTYSGRAISIKRFKNAIIRNNTIEGYVGGAIEVRPNSLGTSNVIVDGNMVYDCGKKSSLSAIILNSGGSFALFNNVIIKNNTVYSNGILEKAIRLDGISANEIYLIDNQCIGFSISTNELSLTLTNPLYIFIHHFSKYEPVNVLASVGSQWASNKGIYFKTFDDLLATGWSNNSLIKFSVPFGTNGRYIELIDGTSIQYGTETFPNLSFNSANSFTITTTNLSLYKAVDINSQSIFTSCSGNLQSTTLYNNTLGFSAKIKSDVELLNTTVRVRYLVIGKIV